jgi:hypothetical protein
MFTYRTLIRDALVNNASIKTLFGATLTGSCRVNLEYVNVSAAYPQIIVGCAGGNTTPGMGGENVQIYITVEAKGTGTTHAHQELGKFRSKILAVLDDTNLSATAVCYHLRKFTESNGIDDNKRIYWMRINFDGEFKQNTNYA